MASFFLIFPLFLVGVEKFVHMPCLHPAHCGLLSLPPSLLLTPEPLGLSLIYEWQVCVPRGDNSHCSSSPFSSKFIVPNCMVLNPCCYCRFVKPFKTWWLIMDSLQEKCSNAQSQEILPTVLMYLQTHRRQVQNLCFRNNPALIKCVGLWEANLQWLRKRMIYVVTNWHRLLHLM